jgi:hypothetical protein
MSPSAFALGSAFAFGAAAFTSTALTSSALAGAFSYTIRQSSIIWIFQRMCSIVPDYILSYRVGLMVEQNSDHTENT